MEKGFMYLNLENIWGECYICNPAINFWHKNRNRKTFKIAPQFEYNTYIRDFIAANKGKKLSDAILCWKYKKSLRGDNKYADADLSALK